MDKETAYEPAATYDEAIKDSEYWCRQTHYARKKWMDLAKKHEGLEIISAIAPLILVNTEGLEERVARAICEVDGLDPDKVYISLNKKPQSWSNEKSPVSWVKYIPQARAALKAIGVE